MEYAGVCVFWEVVGVFYQRSIRLLLKEMNTTCGFKNWFTLPVPWGKRHEKKS